MKRMITIALAILFAGQGHAQQTGIVHYVRTLHMDNSGMDDIPDNIKALMPRENKEKKILLFTPSRSLYKNDVNKDAAPQELSGGGMVIRVQTTTEEEFLFKDYEAKREVLQQNLFGRTFLVNSEWPTQKWKMTGNQKSLLGHPVMEATCVWENDTITAWFTADIPVSAGPESISGLPGLVLEASFGKRMDVVATAIEQGDASLEKKIKEPTKGKKVTREQYAKIQREKTEEVKNEFGNGTNVVIQTIGQ